MSPRKAVPHLPRKRDAYYVVVDGLNPTVLSFYPFGGLLADIFLMMLPAASYVPP